MLDKKGRISASFTQHYWNACSNGSNIGGETLHYLITAIDKVLSLLRDSDTQELFEKEFADQLSKIPPMAPLYTKRQLEHEQVLEKLHDAQFVHKTSAKLTSIKRKYERTIKGYPVVYAVKVEPQWFENWDEPIEELRANANLRSAEQISSDNIVARVDFSNGTIY